jgi:uncharacterized membrane protein
MLGFQRLAIIGLIATTVRSVPAGEPGANAAAITVVPFAVPVAVPVAVVQQPTLFYRVAGTVDSGNPSRTQQAAPRATAPAALSSDAVGSLRDRVADVLQRRCAECHQGSTARGGITLFDEAGRLSSLLPRHLLVEVTDANSQPGSTMPPDGREKLTAEEWRVLKQWARMPKSFVY